jgi:hypothetical protein
MEKLRIIRGKIKINSLFMMFLVEGDMMKARTG